MAIRRLTRKSATPRHVSLGLPTAGEAGKAIHDMLLRLVVDEQFNNGRKTYPRWHQARAVTLSET